MQLLRHGFQVWVTNSQVFKWVAHSIYIADMSLQLRY